MIVSNISIYKKDLFEIKIEIYHQIIGVIIKYKYNNWYLLDKLLGLHFENWSNIIGLKSVAINDLLRICVNKNVW